MFQIYTNLQNGIIFASASTYNQICCSESRSMINIDTHIITVNVGIYLICWYIEVCTIPLVLGML